MKLVIVLCLVAVVQAQPQRYRRPPSDSRILRYYNDYGFPNFKWGYLTSDDVSQDHQGELKNQGREDEALSVRGRFSWVSPEGTSYTTNYVADENGYQPVVEQGPGSTPIMCSVVASLVGGGCG